MYTDQFDLKVESLKLVILDLQTRVHQAPDNISYQAKLNLMKMRLRYLMQTEEQQQQLREIY